MTPRCSCLLLLGLAACEHTSPFTPVHYGVPGPLGAGTPVQVTYNPGQDHTPAWLPDGSAFFYSAEQVDRPDRDRCLALMPAAGGRLRALLCRRPGPADDSVDVFASPAPRGDGRLLLVRTSTPAGSGATAPYRAAIVLASPDSLELARELVALPSISPSGTGYGDILSPAWLTPTALVYVAAKADYVPACDSLGCVLDSLRTGVEIERMSLDGNTPVVEPVPGTDGASSVAAAGGNTLYYTRTGDSVVYRRVLSSGTVSVAYAFPGAIARDVQVAGSRLVAVVGGMVYYHDTPPVGVTQRDYGGDLHVVDLATGRDSLLLTPGPAIYLWFRHPALSRDGRNLVVEARHFQLIVHRDETGTLLWTDTILTPTPDLWLYRLP